MDVRLTQGGEPTFVSIDDRDGAEWNTAALGPTKRRYAVDLLLRLKERYGAQGSPAPGPGQVVSRRAVAALGAVDLAGARTASPAGTTPGLFADEREPRPTAPADAERFMQRLAQRLGIDGSFVLPGYEDTMVLPVARAASAVQRRSVRRAARRRTRACAPAPCFAQGLASPVGYALPIRRDRSPDGSPRWASSRWFLRGERLYLVPGDSPMGYRLPLDSLPWTAAEDEPLPVERDPFAPLEPLPLHADIRAGTCRMPSVAASRKAAPSPAGRVRVARRDRRRASGRKEGRAGGIRGAPRRFESAAAIIRTTLCVEVRDPRRASGPVAEGEAGASGCCTCSCRRCRRSRTTCELIAAVEATAAELKLRIVLEGYPPPRDPRLQAAADHAGSGRHRGQHPSGRPLGTNWSTTPRRCTKRRGCRACRTEKFMLDGRHTGTGGGNHIVLGGATAEDSPVPAAARPARAASSRTGTTIRRCRTCSRACSSDRPARRRASTRRATTQVYELEIALRRTATVAARAARRRRRGWSIGSSAIC